jgi:aspartate 1-decarboxylase
MFERNEAKEYNPKIVFVNEENKVIEIKDKEKHGEI